MIRFNSVNENTITVEKRIDISRNAFFTEYNKKLLEREEVGEGVRVRILKTGRHRRVLDTNACLGFARVSVRQVREDVLDLLTQIRVLRDEKLLQMVVLIPGLILVSWWSGNDRTRQS